MKKLLGEYIGTLCLTFIGCSTVAIAVLYSSFSSIVPIALIWGAGVTLAIYISKGYSSAHLNPAVSFGFYLLKRISLKELLSYFLVQFLGGLTAGVFVFLTFQADIILFDLPAGEPSLATASIFGEFFPNPGYKDLEGQVSVLEACLFEAVGTFLLMLSILIVTTLKSTQKFAPILIGLCVAGLIIMIAPFTQCGMNPARDFGPRVAAYFLQWGAVAFPKVSFSFFTVYILSPVLGAGLSALIFKAVKK